MKLCISITLLFLFSCNLRKESVIYDKEQPVLKVETENRAFIIGDINNDRVNDTAFISYKIKAQISEIECEQTDCSISIKFKQNIPDLNFNDSKGIAVRKTEDLNSDGANEIIVFSRTNQGWWNDVYLWSLKNNIWVMLAKTKAFISDETDFNDRLVKIDSHYYLIGDNQFEEDFDGNFTEIKIKIE